MVGCKERIGEQRGGLNLLRNAAYAPNHFQRISHTLAKIM
jgi:hypothetical protein